MQQPPNPYSQYPQQQFPEGQSQPPTSHDQTQWGQQLPPPYYGQPLPSNAYPQKIPLQPPTKPVQKRGFNKIGWLLASAIILICLLLINIVVSVGKGSNSGSLNDSHNTPANQTVTALQLTEPPTQAPTPTFAPGYGYHMTLGHSYSCSPACLIDNPTNHFNATSQFAFVVFMFEPWNTTHIKLLLVEIGEMGSEAVVYTEDLPLADPNENNLWNSFPTLSLMGSNPYGNYRLEIEDDTTIRAYADFIYER